MEQKTLRQKTNSITHLVKIVAREEIENYMASLPAIDSERLVQEIRRLSYNFQKDIQSNLEMAGKYWSREEEELLTQEVATAISTIAKNHCRSTVAILERITKKGLL